MFDEALDLGYIKCVKPEGEKSLNAAKIVVVGDVRPNAAGGGEEDEDDG